MMGLLDDIQSDLITDGPKIAVTLRKAKVWASQEKNQTLLDWVDAELDGYESDAPHPPYRLTKAMPQGTFQAPDGRIYSSLDIPYSGIPEVVAKLGYKRLQIELSQSASSYEDLITHSQGDSSLIIPWVADASAPLSFKVIPGHSCLKAYYAIPRAALVGLVDSIRNRLLGFTLDAMNLPALTKSESEDSRSQDLTRLVREHFFGGKN